MSKSSFTLLNCGVKKTISIIGGGPSAMFLAFFLDKEKFETTIYEKNNTIGRKFLVAGKGGFNLTHSEEIDKFIGRFFPEQKLEKALNGFTNQELKKFYKEIGIPTFVGTSKRIFPEQGIKPIEVLNAIVEELRDFNVSIVNNHEWDNWDSDANLLFKNGNTIKSDIVVFSLGGGSWKVTGSDGTWIDAFEKKGISTTAFKAANCAFNVKWPTEISDNFLGTPLKNIAISVNNKYQKGELVITEFGLEGNAIYALSKEIQDHIEKDGHAQIYVDLKPNLTEGKVLEKLRSTKEKRTTDALRKDLKLSNAELKLLKTSTTKEEFLDLVFMSKLIKKFPIKVLAAAPIDEAISTYGGVSFDALTEYFELKEISNHFCIGEMVEWNAPTGGYLLQACCSMGVYLAKHLNTLQN